MYDVMHHDCFLFHYALSFSRHPQVIIISYSLGKDGGLERLGNFSKIPQSINMPTPKPMPTNCFTK